MVILAASCKLGEPGNEANYSKLYMSTSDTSNTWQLQIQSWHDTVVCAMY